MITPNNLQNCPYVGVAILVIKNNKVLLGERLSHPGANTWQTPGGSLEYRETPFECAKRELFEEAGLIAQEISMGPWSNDIFEKEKKHFVTLFMIVTKFKGEPKILEPEKCRVWKFFDFDNLPKPLFLSLYNVLKRSSLEEFVLNEKIQR